MNFATCPVQSPDRQIATLADYCPRGVSGIVKKCLASFLLPFLSLCLNPKAIAEPIPAAQAQALVRGWLKSGPVAIEAATGNPTDRIETFNGADGKPLYYVVALEPEGFAVVSGDDLIEPIIAFAPKGKFDPSKDNPLVALLGGDLPNRFAKIKGEQKAKAQGASLEAARKWERLASMDQMDANADFGVNNISDVRVAPLVQSEWDQKSATGTNTACYNYYTPPYAAGDSANYVSGCVATAMAQLMRYWQWPTGSVGTSLFTIKVDGFARTRALRGGNGSGGAYQWGSMVLSPNSSTSLIQRQAIGALCHDAGVATSMSYTANLSGTDTKLAKDAFVNTFGYASAIKGGNGINNIGSALSNMVNPNLDAGFPVLLGITGTPGGHAIVCDGYGYNASTLYHHLNLGWSGYNNAWYNLPTINTDVGLFSSVYKCVYNVWPTGSGEIISGRVTDSGGNPVPGVTITATRSASTYTATSNSQGIYALAKIPASSTYTVNANKSGYYFTSQTVTTGVSADDTTSPGNRWAINFSDTPLTAPTIITSSPLADASIGVTYTQVLSATGGVSPYTWSISSGSLPAGLTLSAAGVLSGVPLSTGTASFSVKVAGGDGKFSTTNFALTITSAPIIATSSPLLQATVGISYSQTLAASGGTLPYSWSISAGSLPTGLDLSTGGVLSGTPASEASTSVTVRVTGSNGQSSTKVFSLTAAPASGTVATALDQADLVFSTSGDVPWFSQTSTTHDGIDAARSGAITGSQTSEMQTTMSGPGTFSFWQKISSERDYDFLRFYIDGVEQSSSISGEVDWQQMSYSLSSGSHTLKWAYAKDGSINSGSDCAWVDQLTLAVASAPTITTTSPLPSGTAGVAYSQTLTASGGTTPFTWSISSGSLPAGLGLSSAGVISGTPSAATTATFTVRVTGGNGLSSTLVCSLTITASAGPLSASLDQPGLTFTNSGSLPWFSQTSTTHDGVDAARSGAITGSQTSEMQTTVSGPGTFSFWRKVSSETNYDYLRFYIDGIEQSGSISGEVAWQQVGYSLSSGSHTLKWVYAKDVSISSGSDCAWVDQFTLPAVSAPTITTTSPLPSGSVGVAYSQTLTASGGTAPYAWSISSGSLPAGLSLSSAGVISGTPIAAATAAFTVRVTGGDSLASTSGFSLTTVVPVSLASAMDQPGRVITTSGSQLWVSQSATTRDGIDAAKSGTITHNQWSVMQTTVTGPGTVSFWWKVSSEEDYDYLTFYIDGFPQSGVISGSVDWTQKSYNLTAGSHVLEWEYSKDSSLSSGSDCGWVDQLIIPEPAAPFISTLNPLSSGMIGVAYNQAIAALGGSTPYTWSLASGSLPAGLSLSSAGVISGVPSAAITASFAVQVTGGDGLSSKKDFNLTIANMGPFTDDFEPDIDMYQWSEFGGTVGNTVLATTYGSAVSGTNSLWFGDAGSRYATSRSINTIPGGVVNFNLRFANGTNSPWESPDLPAEGVVLEYSIDSGSSWVEFARYNTAAYRSWTHLAVNIPVAAKTANTRFRWRQLANNVGSDHWALDDVAVSINLLPPTVSAPTSAETMATAARLGGNATNDGGATITERGVVYAVTTVNNNPVIGGTGVTKIASSGTTGLFTVAASGLASGTNYSFKAYAINSAGTSYTPVANFTTLSPAQCHAAWAAANGLTGNNALPDASPHGDGLKNLIKYAFNLNGSGPDVHRMRAGRTSGQPGAWILQQGAQWYLHVEYVRRNGSGLIYTPKMSTSLEVGSFQPMTGTAVISQIDSNWERVVIEEPYDPANTPMLFSIVEVKLP